MDGTVLALFLFATFVGAVVAGLAGFAMSLVVSGIWLHILTPIQTVTLIVGYGLLVQGYGIWKLRHALSWRRAMPFIGGGAVGMPTGAGLLAYINRQASPASWWSCGANCVAGPKTISARFSSRWASR